MTDKLNDPQMKEAFDEFKSTTGLKDSDLTLGEKILFAIAFSAGKASCSRASVVPLDAAARNKH